jgi:hypothetical protein
MGPQYKVTLILWSLDSPLGPPDCTVAHIPGSGANFRADKRGAKVCINWKRGQCKFGERCIYSHGEPGPRPQATGLQAMSDAAISPLERDLVGYRMAAAGVGGEAGPGSGKRPEPPVASDWYQEGGAGLGTADATHTITKQLTGNCETDFTKVPKKKSKWD